MQNKWCCKAFQKTCKIFKCGDVSFVNRNNSPWFNHECKVFKHGYINALRAFNIDKSIENRNIVCEKKNAYKKLLRKKKYEYKVGQRKNIEALRKSSPKEFWKHFSKCKGKSVCNDISCDEFYGYFSNLENNIFSVIDHETETVISREDFASTDAVYEDIDNPISIEEVSNAIKSLKSNKAPGNDDLLNEYFICASDILSPFLCELFNTVFNAGVFPDKWLEGIIIPLHKKDQQRMLIIIVV